MSIHFLDYGCLLFHVQPGHTWHTCHSRTYKIRFQISASHIIYAIYAAMPACSCRLWLRGCATSAYKCDNMWAIGKTSIEKCDLGSKLSLSGLHYRFTVYPDCIIRIPWQNACGKPFLHLHFSVCSIFDCPALSFPALQLYGVVWYLPMQLQITVAPCFLQLRNKLWIQFVGRSPGELSQRHAPCLSFTRQRLRSKPSTWSNAFALAIFI